MIRELTKSYLKNHKPTYVVMYSGTDIYDIEWMLIDKYNCYYWNGGDYHQDTQHHIGDIVKYRCIFEVAYSKKGDMLILNEVGFVINTKRIEYERQVEEVHERRTLSFGIKIFVTLSEFRRMKIKKIIKNVQKR